MICSLFSRSGYLFCHRIQRNAVGTADMPLACIVFLRTKDEHKAGCHRFVISELKSGATDKV